MPAPSVNLHGATAGTGTNGAAFPVSLWMAGPGSCFNLAARAAADGKLSAIGVGFGVGAIDAGTTESKRPTFNIAANSSFRCSSLHVLSFFWSPSLMAAETSAARFSSPGGSTMEPATIISGLTPASPGEPAAAPTLVACKAAFRSLSRLFSSRSSPASPLSLAFCRESSWSSSPKRRTPNSAFRWNSMASRRLLMALAD
mmetsp:Transcript_53496/g.148300  ORF Transcript_53496/g.148300 Transcript_53496/m.148300 type:complete len:200 (+) Transcript_53496:584-1183(+)